jgi:hypothetical protein
MALAELSPQRLLGAHHLLGASTGHLADLRRDWGELITTAPLVKEYGIF